MYAIVNKKNNVVVRVVNNYEIIENTLKAKGIFDKNDFNTRTHTNITHKHTHK